MQRLIVFVLSTLVLSCANSLPCSEMERVDISAGDKHENGSITYEGLEYKFGTWYEATEDGVSNTYGCPCIGRICVWKCCEEGSLYLGRNCSGSQAAEVNPFSPQVFTGQSPANVDASQHFHYMYNALTCPTRYLVDTEQSFEDIFIQKNGTLIEFTDGELLWHPPIDYCVDMMQDNETLPPRLIALVCHAADAVEDNIYLYIAYAAGLYLSVPFLLATFLVYGLIAELRNLHGMCLMAYCAGLIVAYPLLAYLKISVGEVGVYQTGCLVIAFIIYYAFQTSFFWLNVMCFDIWRTFRSFVPPPPGTTHPYVLALAAPRARWHGLLFPLQNSLVGYRGGRSTKHRDRKRFALYGIYAWGVPLVLTAITAAMQFSDGLSPSIIRPNFGNRRCWFEDWLSELVYFMTPVLALVVCNSTLFAVTARRIHSIKQETAILKSAESSRSDKLKRDKQRYGLYLKLFIVMGVNWTVELISFAAGGSNWYWILIDLSNIGLGVFIFFIFVWKQKVRNLIRKKFAKWRGVSTEPPTMSDTSRWARSSTAATEVTRVSTDEAGVRLRDLEK